MYDCQYKLWLYFYDAGLYNILITSMLITNSYNANNSLQ